MTSTFGFSFLDLLRTLDDRHFALDASKTKQNKTFDQNNLEAVVALLNHFHSSKVSSTEQQQQQQQQQQQRHNNGSGI